MRIFLTGTLLLMNVFLFSACGNTGSDSSSSSGNTDSDISSSSLVLDKSAGQPAALISGKVAPGGRPDASDVTIVIFNGFEQTETKADASGNFSAALPSGTSNAQYTIFAYRNDGCLPVALNRSFDGAPEIKLGTINLPKLSEPDKGIMAGVVFDTVAGGKIKWVKGISKYHPDYHFQIKDLTAGSRQIKIVTNADGFYSILLAPGRYLVPVNGQQTEIEIKKGQVQIVNIQKGETLID